MLGSHNSFTCKSPRWWIFNLFSHYWKCLKKSIDEQYNCGVRYFDIRVRKIKSGYLVCHGIVDVNWRFNNLKHICIYMRKHYPKALFRLILERGPVEEFKNEIKYIKKYNNVDEILIKKPWETLYKCKKSLPMVEYSFEDWTWKNILKGIFHNIIEEKEEISNADAIADKTTIHLIDFL